ncbi:MAG: Na(+)/H(+) antiporter subunit D [Thermodesulfovibrio sp.]|nr:Na(+)/H(+) antiporter subunit D [Thermodesulfovibrio sp.]MCX7724131.1 Na(+)/H(+) antiporter subunit D [Thermodesulfovibrio sp.]MDW7971805.1 Na(+)/H(+) antiporter subunit D [Thermodesulfovibrio sp.]
MISPIPPAILFILGAFLIPFLRGKLLSIYLLSLPVLGFINFINLPEGVHYIINFLEYKLILVKVDKISIFFGYIYHIITFIALFYSLHVRETAQHIASIVYSGAALGVVFAGDLLTLFIFWEMMAFSAFYLIWASRTRESYGAGLRYLLVHIVGGLFLLFGVVIRYYETGSLSFGYIGLDGLSSWLIFLGFGINCAFPGLHAWLPDAYPKTTPTGGVFMWTFTTKTAIYVLARAFPGEEILIWIGAIMTVFPIFFAVIENDLRKVLSYSLINQLGYMVTGIGIGTQLSLNGTFSHVFCHILYKALLVMSMGAVIYRTGKIKCTDLGGLYKSMPLTALFCIIGAASISAFPLFSGFVSKSMVVEASAIEGLIPIWFMLTFASVGVLEHAGIKVPYYAFFAHDSGIRTKESPLHMLIAMGITAFLCIFIGVMPSFLYSLLPYPVNFEPYTASHIVSTTQLLLAGILAYVLLMKAGVFPEEMRSTNLDLDWFYRKGAQAFVWFINNPGAHIMQRLNTIFFVKIPNFLGWFTKNPLLAVKILIDSIILAFSIPEKRRKIKARLRTEKLKYPGDPLLPMPVGVLVLWSIFFLLLYLIIYYTRGYM